MEEKKKNKQKKKDWMKGIFLIILLFVIAGIVLIIYGKVQGIKKQEEVVVTNVYDSIEKYGYEINDNVTDYYKQEFAKLKDMTEEEEIAKQVAKLFVIDLYSINYKINKYEVTSTQYFYSDKRDMHRSKVLDTIYKLVHDNSYDDRKQELPEVSNVEVKKVEKSTFEIENEDKKDKNKNKRESYVVLLKIEYVKDLGYDDEAEVTLIKDGDNNISVVKLRTK